ncbi:STAS domain-containing protein [Streptomyces sp. NBC_00193]|uniref:STAS domain-containing protein n=1 Tax=unclassified Streptomyces TaxID=2593676 RepID=UPI002254CFD3|nr:MULTISPECIES: STAS domain-containing protein [unclassified Streptomyces]MCX5129920.1 STAS domain-containing protein [Streptomyces sp. NBC_00347]MCX5300400.1 STAS domain-containing protein [Streptomyces sp. NBC_00193]
MTTHPTQNLSSTTSTGPRTVLTIAGAIDMDTCPHITATLDLVTLDGRTLVLDLSAITFMDSSGLNLLLTLRNRAEAEQGTLELCGLPDQALRLLDITGARDLFTLTP